MRRIACTLLLCLFSCIAAAADGNRLAYLDGPLDPYYPHRDFPKLITPQWVGEEGVECVVTLAIDDMRDSAKYEAFLRPILERLKKIDGRAPVSIMSCRVQPEDPQLQAWLKEGLSIEVHTYDHPCPCLQDGGLVKAKETYDKCVDLMNQIPGNKPVAFRMPCCDSKNTPSPRFWAEVFNKTTEKGNFLQIDSSVFNIITNKDKELPKEITELPDGSERFRRYVPFENFVNTIEDYPYPYIIGGMCWEFPCVVPSDWSAQHVQKPNNPDTVRDWKLALDACVIKQGTFNLVFHPHGWIKAEQIVELIDHAVEKHGKKVKFLTFRECAERLNLNLVGSSSLRNTKEGASKAVVLDANNDGFMDVVRPLSASEFEGLFWNPKKQSWMSNREKGVWRSPRWGTTWRGDERFMPSVLLPAPSNNSRSLYVSDGDQWHELLTIFPLGRLGPKWGPLALRWLEADDTFFRDFDGNGQTEMILVEGEDSRILERIRDNGWQVATIELPNRVPFSSEKGDASGLRLGDVNSDGKLDCLFSNQERYCLYLFKDMKEGWATKVFDVVRGKEEVADNGNKVPVIPPFVRADGTNNGAWFHSSALWLQNEDTWRLPDGVFKLTFEEMLAPLDKKDTGPQRKQGKTRPAPVGRIALEEPALPSLALRACVDEEPTPNPQSSQPLATSTSTPPAPSSDARYDDLKMPPPLSPEESLKALHVRPGMKVEVVAAEPLIVDPVAFDWGPDGRLWVIEMRDYPSGITWKKEGDEFGKPGGQVKVLTDVDGDGRYDKAATFLDELPFPTGIKVWRKGVLVTAAPEILYAEDKDGDDKADEKVVLYRGFGEGNQQHRVNGLRWGLDNWLHVGNGDSGGVIKSLTKGLNTQARSASEELEINVAGRDLRIRPDTGELEATSGNTQFGRETDDWGNWFGNNNSDPLWHYTLDDRYLRRNPHATYPPVKKQVASVPGAAPVYPKSQTLTRFNDDNKANRFTSACGPTIYRDTLLGEEFYGNSFVCEPVHNLVHREILQPQGATFTSKRAADEQTSEFLASEDSWFRPSMCRTGPDGALWVSDMYRFVIEHPKWIPPAAQAKLDLRAGEDKGRIYRIYPEGKQPRPIVRLDKLDTAGLVAALDSPNGTQRDLVHQMLLWRNDKVAVEPLAKLAAESKRPQARLQALAAIDGLIERGMGVWPAGSLERAIGDEHPAIRRQAVRIAERQLSSSPELTAAILNLAGDPDLQVRIQVAYTLGELQTPAVADKLASLLLASPADPYLTAAALSSLNKENIEPVIERLLSNNALRASGDVFERLLTVAIGLGSDTALRKTLDAVLTTEHSVEPWRFQTLATILDALERRNRNVRDYLGPDARRALDVLIGRAREAATFADGEPARLLALRLLGRSASDAPQDVHAIMRLLAPQQPAAVQSAAVTAMLRIRQPDTATNLLRGWSTYAPALRNQIADSLTSREDWSLAILDAVAKGDISASQFDARRRQQFLSARSKAVRDKAETVLAGSIDTNRQKLVEAYLTATDTNHGDATHGKLAFTKRCANCHKFEGTGHAIGPDLAALARKPADYLLTAILDPNRAVEDRYLEYVALTADGRQLAGILVEETGASLTLAAPEGKSHVIPRSELEQLKSSGKSLMPEGIERDVPPAEMTDILAYLKSSALPPKQLALNQPEIVQPFNDGSIRLFATNCRAYGPTIKMEETFRALGWWNSQEDHCAWSFDVPAGGAGSYRVTLEYSCDNASAGNTVVVEANGQSLTGTVASSGGWDKYRGWNLGTLKLEEGRGELLVRSSGPIKGALFDLGGIRLVPVK